MVNTFFSRKGGKKLLKNRIIEKIPEHKKYVEPFVGTGAVYLAKDSAEKSVINDRDKEVYKLWKDMKNRPESFNACRTPVNRGQFNKLKDKSQKTSCDILGLNKMSYMGSGKQFTDNKSVCEGNKAKCGMKSLPKNIPKYKDKLKTTQVLNEDYKKVFNKHDGKNTFTYMDPPYWETSNDYGGMENNVHPSDVCKLARNAKGNVMISYNNHAEVRKSCKGLNIKKVDTKYEIGKNRHGGGGKAVKEVIITNY